MKDSAMKAIISKLEQSSTVFTFLTNRVGDDRSQGTNIYWDPTSALHNQADNGSLTGGHQSPLGLGHEMAHAAENPFIRSILRGTYWGSGAYQNQEEKRVITAAEKHAAITLGEGVRTNHYGQPYTVDSVLSH